MSRALAVIAKLRSLGLDAEEILSVVEVMEGSRSDGAERTAKYRARKRAETCDVTCDTSPCVTEAIEKEKAPQTPKKENPPSKENPPKGGQKKGSPLSPDWKPTDADWAEAVRTLGKPRAELELSKFRDHWLSVGGRKVDWDATWRNWFRKAPDFAPRFGSPQAAVVGLKPHVRESLIWVEEGSDDWAAWKRAKPGYLHSQLQERSENGKTLVGAYLPSAQPVKQGAAA